METEQKNDKKYPKKGKEFHVRIISLSRSITMNACVKATEALRAGGERATCRRALYIAKQVQQ